MSLSGCLLWQHYYISNMKWVIVNWVSSSSSHWQETKERRLWVWWEEAFPVAVSKENSNKTKCSSFQNIKAALLILKYQIANTHVTARFKVQGKYCPTEMKMFYYRVFKKNISCNNHGLRCLRETTQARYDRIKTWGVLFLCAFLQWRHFLFILSKLKISIIHFFHYLAGSSEEWVHILYWWSFKK